MHHSTAWDICDSSIPWVCDTLWPSWSTLGTTDPWQLFCCPCQDSGTQSSSALAWFSCHYHCQPVSAFQTCNNYFFIENHPSSLMLVMPSIGKWLECRAHNHEVLGSILWYDRLYMSEVKKQNTRGRLSVKWRDRVNEYFKEKNDRIGVDHAVRELYNREKWTLFYYGYLYRESHNSHYLAIMWRYYRR